MNSSVKRVAARHLNRTSGRLSPEKVQQANVQQLAQWKAVELLNSYSSLWGMSQE